MAEPEETKPSTFCVWYFLCCFGILTFLVYRFFRGRRQVRLAFEIMEEQLRCMQAMIEREEATSNTNGSAVESNNNEKGDGLEEGDKKKKDE